MKKRIQFIINPISGVGKKDLIPSLLEKHLDKTQYEFEIIYTERRGHAYEIAQEAVKNKIDIVCVVGGDGSINEVGSALLHTNTALAIIPAGSGNGIARHFKIPLSYKKAIEHLNQSDIHEIDTLSVNEETAIGFVGFGFDAVIAKRFDEYHSRGLASYAKLVINEWKSYSGTTLKINGKTYENLMFCVVANTSQFGNNVYISPESDASDGKLELVLASLPSTLQLADLVVKSALKKIHNSKRVEILTVEECVIEGENLVVHADGDPININSNKQIVKCLNKSLKLVY